MTQYQIMKEKMNKKALPPKEAIPVTFNNERVGNAYVSDNGSVIMNLHSPVLKNQFGAGLTEHIALVPKKKEK